ncbi:MAG: GNAT family N-acetyltransferase [Clostridiaceae bacterium]|nr:GNAT family N-acetyltransferase [Clostridiaceae bacterium]
MTNIQYRQVDLSDLKAIKYISEKTFEETFSHLNSPEDMALYFQENTQDDILIREMNNPDSTFYIAEDQGEVIGYIKINRGPAQTEPGHDDALEVQRLYVLKAYKGSGIGRRLMQEAIDRAIESALRYVWLGVWEHNVKAIRFYEKLGFRPFGEHLFMLGSDPQTDLLMRLDV